MIRLGLQIPNFTYPGVDNSKLFAKVAEIAQAAEQSGFDSIWVMDHFYQLPLLGPADNAMLEAYTLLGALAARTTTARLGTLVTGVTYRNPAILAKQVTTLDVISGGRAVLGIGAAWFAPEHEGLGVDFPPVGERMDRLEEALLICRAMLRSDRPVFNGRYYRVRYPINSPAPLQADGPPVLIGGSGEKRTLKLVAQYADAVNLICGRDEIPHKLDVLAGHCEKEGRDPATINKTWLASAVIGPSPAEAIEARDQMFAARGIAWGSMDSEARAALSARLLVGTPEVVGGRLRQLTIDQGLDGAILNFPANGHDLDVITHSGPELLKAMGGQPS
jgi:F420-dependent oxidoreductase-like protein